MTVLANRTDAEAALVRALSRHIGHTTAAYDLDRILSVLDYFVDRPSGYREEIIGFIAAEESGNATLGEGYLDGVISFARALGIIQQTSSREARLQKYAATEQGRSLLAGQKSGSADFSSFYKARVAFLADADSLMAILSYFETPQESSLVDFYVTFFSELRAKRYAWLRDAFKEAVLFERIARQLGWLKLPSQASGEVRIEPFTLNTARHHSTPRKGWLASFGMLNRETEELTDFGKQALASLRKDGRYFWLGPPRGVQDALRLPKALQRQGPFEDEFAFTADASDATRTQMEALAPEVVDLMYSAFPFAKLIHASQASLHLPIEFIIYRSFTDGVRYDPIEVLKIAFHENRDRVDRLSALKGQIGFYRIRH